MISTHEFPILLDNPMLVPIYFASTISIIQVGASGDITPTAKPTKNAEIHKNIPVRTPVETTVIPIIISAEIMNILVEMNKNRGATTVFVSHDLEVAEYGKRTIVITDGKIIGDTKEEQNNFKKITGLMRGNPGGEKR